MFDPVPGEAAGLDFDELANLVLDQGLHTSPSELHGCLAGLLGAGPVADPAAALDSLNQAVGLDLHGELAEQVMLLFSATLAVLEDEGFDFQPLLPGDEVELEQRTAALGDWCRGFLKGYTRAGGAGTGDRQVPGDSAEVLRDFAAISQAGVDDDLPAEESEASYAELVEYLRCAALNVFFDSRSGAGGTRSGSA